MTALGERIIDFLRTQPDVSLVNDASSRNTGDGIRCYFGGSHWFIAIDSGGEIPAEDPRENNRREGAW